jgi:hypothetical protein
LPRSDEPEESAEGSDKREDAVLVFNDPACILLSGVPERAGTGVPSSLTGDERPDWPVWAACAGRHMTRMASDRNRNIRQSCPFIQVHYTEKLHKYNLIAAATHHVLKWG